jgi:hypothetical protein
LFYVTENIHFVWHFCFWCLFVERSHTKTLNLFINGAQKPWSGAEDAKAILFAELNALLPALEKKGVTIPDVIRGYAKEAVAQNLLSAYIQEAREQFRKSMLGNTYAAGFRNSAGHGAPLGNRNSVGHGAKLGNRNGVGTKPSLYGNKHRTGIYKQDGASPRTLQKRANSRAYKLRQAEKKKAAKMVGKNQESKLMDAFFVPKRLEDGSV